MDHPLGTPAHLILLNPERCPSVVIRGHHILPFDSQNHVFLPHNVGDLCTQAHTSLIRVARFDTTGNYLVTGGDDKKVKVWETNSWKCLGTRTGTKKVSGVAFVDNNVIWSDRGGMVFEVSLEKLDNSDGVAKDFVDVKVLLGHCSWITTLEIWDKKYILTGEKDEKIRVSLYPDTYDIVSFCLGHKTFVTSLCLLPVSETESAFLVSGSGDGIVILWEFVEGTMLQQFDMCSFIGPEHSVVRSIVFLASLSLVAICVEDHPTIELFRVNLLEDNIAMVHDYSISLDSAPLFLHAGWVGSLWTVNSNNCLFHFIKGENSWAVDFSQSVALPHEAEERSFTNLSLLSFRECAKFDPESRSKEKSEKSIEPKKKRRKRLGGKAVQTSKS
eukprot:TRINITY_DN4738_c0_g1_i13.p1 TRINITY_DN4738_c0_g1~~TRINITY_DN4738_c0_g1_i13.p1  ORF type:complete len:424 (-),score=72.72 TRINITY_DN4738_c0_g1_i13:175-1335(-)